MKSYRRSMGRYKTRLIDHKLPFLPTGYRIRLKATKWAVWSMCEKQKLSRFKNKLFWHGYSIQDYFYK